MTTSKESEVGYGKPPEHAKWKKGQCGNPKRIRKRPVKPVAELVDEFFASEGEVVENGVSQRRSAFEIILSTTLQQGDCRESSRIESFETVQ